MTHPVSDAQSNESPSSLPGRRDQNDERERDVPGKPEHERSDLETRNPESNGMRVDNSLESSIIFSR